MAHCMNSIQNSHKFIMTDIKWITIRRIEKQEVPAIKKKLITFTHIRSQILMEKNVRTVEFVNNRAVGTI